MIVEVRLLGDDRQAVVDGQDHLPDRLVVFGDEVVETGADAVAGAALLDRVREARVHPAPLQQRRAARGHAPGVPGLLLVLGDVARVVVEVAASVGPADVVQDHERKVAVGPPRRVAQQRALVVDGVPVVVAVDQCEVERPGGGQHVEAEVAVEVVLPGEAGFVLGGVELGYRVDHVDLGVGTEVLEHPDRRLTPECTDLDDPTRVRDADEGGDDGFPEWVHGGLSGGDVGARTKCGGRRRERSTGHPSFAAFGAVRTIARDEWPMTARSPDR